MCRSNRRMAENTGELEEPGPDLTDHDIEVAVRYARRMVSRPRATRITRNLAAMVFTLAGEIRQVRKEINS